MSRVHKFESIIISLVNDGAIIAAECHSSTSINRPAVFSFLELQLHSRKNKFPIQLKDVPCQHWWTTELIFISWCVFYETVIYTKLSNIIYTFDTFENDYYWLWPVYVHYTHEIDSLHGKMNKKCRLIYCMFRDDEII